MISKTKTTAKIPMRTTDGCSAKFKFSLVLFISIIFFSLSVSAQDVTPPVLRNPSVGCSSLDMADQNECITQANNFNTSTLASAVAALYMDAGGPVTATLINTTPGPYQVSCFWSFTYTFKISDPSNNFVTCDVNRSGADVTAPSFTPPSDKVLYVDANCYVDDSPNGPAGKPTNVSDNCQPASSLMPAYEDAVIRAATCGSYTINRTWHLFDSCGNPAPDRMQVITVLDTIKPVFTVVPAANLTPSGCSNVIYDVQATDNCSTVDFTYVLTGATNESDIGTGSGANFSSGVTHVTVKATDGCGNWRQISFNVTITDNIPPVIRVRDIYRQYPEDNYGCSINLGATATDNCQLLSLTSNAPVCFPVGTTTVTWTAVDIHNNVSTKTQLVTRIPPEIKITICAAITKKIYRGSCNGVGPLGPQSVNLTTTVSGGAAPYTYHWTPSAGLSNPNIPNPVANPSNTTTYTLTVTDAFNNSRSLSITVYVYQLSDDKVSGNGSGTRFKVCHIATGEHDKPVEKNEKRDNCNQHLNHNSGHDDCYLGECDEQCVTTPSGGGGCNSRGVNADGGITNGNTGAKFLVNVSPNPTNREFLIQIFSTSDAPVTVRIFDNNGVLKSISTPESGTNYVIVGSNWNSGMYFAEVSQGANRKVVKLLKLK